MGIDKGAGKAAKGLKDKLAGAQKPAAADKHQLRHNESRPPSSRRTRGRPPRRPA